jgi:hypothetical protein
MKGSAVVYSGLIVAVVGLVLLVRPGSIGRDRAAIVVVGGAFVAAAGLALPASESRAVRAESRLDELVPVWQFRERHAIRIAASPERVFDAVRRVRAGEIFLFRTLTWIRRGGRPQPRSILDAAGRDSLIDVATQSTFAFLANDPPRELVIGTVIRAPSGWRGKPTAELFRSPPAPGFTVAAMNFLVLPGASGGSVLTTETRVFANAAAPRRRFAAYWRVIYPGSALIRRMWLRAVERRATTAASDKAS